MSSKWRLKVKNGEEEECFEEVSRNKEKLRGWLNRCFEKTGLIKKIQ